MFGWFKKQQATEDEEESAFVLQLPNVKPGTSFIGATLLISGKITGEGDVLLHGRHEGSIDLDGDLAIRESAVVSGVVAARTISVSGMVDGDLRAREKLAVRRTARVSGTIAAPAALVEEGAFLEGKVEMNGSE